MKRAFIVQIILLSFFFAAVGLSPRPVNAASTIVVDTTADIVADDGFCSLREAIIAANSDAAFSNCLAGSGSDTIEFDPALPAPATFFLTIPGKNEDAGLTGDLDLTGIVTITGTGEASTIIDGSGMDRVLHIHPAARATVAEVTIRNGNPGAGENGGGIALEQTARLTLNNSTVTENTAASGGGIHVLGGLTLNNSTVNANQAGGLHNIAGLLVLSNVQILDNLQGYGITNEQGGFLQYTGGEVRNNGGGGILNDDSTAEINNLTVDGNTVGGGLYNKGVSGTATFTINSSLINNNAGASGAGLLNEGISATATVDNSRITLNNATASGGGISNTGSLTLKNSTIDHNQGRTGGGINHSGFSFQAENITVTTNTATDNGGGIANGMSMSLSHATISGNSSDTGGNIYNDGDSPQISFANTIVTNPVSGGNCVNPTGSFNSLGHNVENTDSCSFSAAGDMVNTDPLLGQLRDNGGPTPTHALLPGSPAIDQGDSSYCPISDQRGAVRPSGAGCDIGAYENDTPVVIQDFALGSGWNTISLNVYPFEPAVADLLAGIQSDMVLMKNGAGESYWPAFFTDQIGDWKVEEGYMIYMNNPATLSITGYQIDPTLKPITLQPGWNLAAYLRQSAMPIDTALSGVSGQLYLAKNASGEVYWLDYNINQIGNMEPGQGYKFYMNSTAVLTYPGN
jgi:CSLREA domain-containing protein